MSSAIFLADSRKAWVSSRPVAAARSSARWEKGGHAARSLSSSAAAATRS